MIFTGNLTGTTAQQAGIAASLAAQAVLLLAIDGDWRASFTLLRSAASCWPHRDR